MAEAVTHDRAEATTTRDVPITIIKPARGWFSLGLGELSHYTDLTYFLIWRDIKVRYKQTALGAAWAVLQPFLLMVVFTVFLGNFVGVKSDGLPYPIFAYSALVPWTLFASSLSTASESLVANTNLVSKVYFPRVLLPFASAASFLIDFAIAMVLLIGMMFFYDITPTANMVWLPLFTLLAFATALAVGIWFSAINVKYRDVRYAIPFLVQVWLFATPVAYSSSAIPQKWQAVYALNPMAGVVEGFRWALLGKEQRPDAMVFVSAAATVVILIAGLAYFHRAERTFADVI